MSYKRKGNVSFGSRECEKMTRREGKAGKQSDSSLFTTMQTEGSSKKQVGKEKATTLVAALNLAGSQFQ